jgi:acetylornithine/succinyldiaminopimelate/putrescine aminotransferase
MLDMMFKPDFLDHVKKMGKQFSEGLNDFEDKYPELITGIRGRGLMWGIELADEFTSMAFTLSMIKNGVLADYCTNHKVTNKIMPPLIVQPADVDEILRRLEQAIKGLQ